VALAEMLVECWRASDSLARLQLKYNFVQNIQLV
jgi:hypothetical protein